MPLPDPIIEVLAAFRPLFTAPTWRKLMILLTGTLLAHGRRAVATARRPWAMRGRPTSVPSIRRSIEHAGRLWQ